jgi:hypothetical protein
MGRDRSGKRAAQGLGVVPGIVRDKARVIKLNKFNTAIVDQLETPK